jgi:hypothetical protein
MRKIKIGSSTLLGTALFGSRLPREDRSAPDIR